MWDSIKCLSPKFWRANSNCWQKEKLQTVFRNCREGDIDYIIRSSTFNSLDCVICFDYSSVKGGYIFKVQIKEHSSSNITKSNKNLYNEMRSILSHFYFYSLIWFITIWLRSSFTLLICTSYNLFHEVPLLGSYFLQLVELSR